MVFTCARSSSTASFVVEEKQLAIIFRTSITQQILYSSLTNTVLYCILSFSFHSLETKPLFVGLRIGIQEESYRAVERAKTRPEERQRKNRFLWL